MNDIPSSPRRQALRLLALGAGALSFPAVLRAQSDRRIVLGQSAPLSGSAAQLGTQLNQGARLFFDQFNAAGGVAGRTVELRALDDAYDPQRSKANTEQFIQQDVFALFGYVGAQNSLAALPLTTQANLPFFAPVTGAEALREPLLRHVFHLRASYFDEAALIARQLSSAGIKRVGVFYQSDIQGSAGLDGVLRALKEQGLTTVAVGTVARNSTDVAAAVSTIVAAQPETVLQICAYKSSAAFIRAARKAGYAATFYNVSFVGTQALADELGREARGVMVTQVMPYPYGGSSPIAREYMEAAQRAGVAPSYSGMEGYLAARVFAEGLRRAPRLTRDGLIAGLESISNLSIGGFNVHFGPRDRVASRFVELSMLTEDGRVRR